MDNGRLHSSYNQIINETDIKYIGATFVNSTNLVTQDMLDIIADKYGYTRPHLYGNTYKISNGFNPLFYQSKDSSIITQIIDSRLNILSVYDQQNKKNTPIVICEELPNIFKSINNDDTIFTDQIKLNIQSELKKESVPVEINNKMKKLKYLIKIDEYYKSDDYRASMQDTSNLLALGKKANTSDLKIYVKPMYKLTSECVIEINKGDTIYYIPKPSFRLLPGGNKGIFTPDQSIDLTLYILIRRVTADSCNYFMSYITFNSNQENVNPDIYTVQLVLKRNIDDFKSQAINNIGKNNNLQGVFSNLNKELHNKNKIEIDQLITDLISLNMFKTKYISEKIFSVKNNKFDIDNIGVEIQNGGKYNFYKKGITINMM